MKMLLLLIIKNLFFQNTNKIGHIYFHKDLASHYVRPDFVNMVAVRSNPENEIATTFVKNIDVIDRLSFSEIELLRETRFHTPFDDLNYQ